MYQYTEDREVLVGQPKEYPTALVEGLRALFASAGCVESAYLVQMYDPRSGEPPHNLVGVLMKPGSMKAFSDFAPEMARATDHVRKEGEFFDIVDMSTETEMGKFIASKNKAFYP